MKAISTKLDGALILEAKIHGDARGFFMESYNAKTMRDLGIHCDFVQDNHSRSTKGVLRGMHYQIKQPQGKLVRVVRGSAFDVAVDMRKSSKTFGQWTGVELSEDNHRQFWIPPGFAHGFLSLSDSVDFLYKVTDYYAPEHERTLIWNDPKIGIEWPLQGEPIIATKDLAGLPFDQMEAFA